jgi:hypothetical protein
MQSVIAPAPWVMEVADESVIFDRLLRPNLPL